MVDLVHLPAIETLEEAASAYWGARGRWVYAAFRWANRALFAETLPPPFVQWAMTPHGACLGQVFVDSVSGPVVVLHPSAWGDGSLHARERVSWGRGEPVFPSRLFTLDVLVHELLHVRVRQLGGRAYVEGLETKRISSHDNPWWPAEVERLSPLLGLGPVKASPTKRARRRGRMIRVPAKEDSLPLSRLSSFPFSLRSAAYYLETGRIPFAEPSMETREPNVRLTALRSPPGEEV